jgi:hypothetical protein
MLRIGGEGVVVEQREEPLGGRLCEPWRADAEQRTKTLEVAVEVQHIQTCGLRRNRDRQVRERQTVGPVGTTVGEFAHRGQHAPLHGPIDGDLAQTLQRAIDGRDAL